jgi:hypothetical protein
LCANRKRNFVSFGIESPELLSCLSDFLNSDIRYAGLWPQLPPPRTSWFFDKTLFKPISLPLHILGKIVEMATLGSKLKHFSERSSQTAQVPLLFPLVPLPNYSHLPNMTTTSATRHSWCLGGLVRVKDTPSLTVLYSQHLARARETGLSVLDIGSSFRKGAKERCRRLTRNILLLRHLRP